MVPMTRPFFQIDYQVCTWSSPAIDLIYALYAMASIETRNEHRNDLLSIYYATFSDTLKKIGYFRRVPTFLDLQVELLRCGFMEVLVSAVFLPYYSLDLSDPVPGVDMTRLFDPDYGIDFRQFVCEQPKYTADMQKWLPRFVYRGFMD
jgi:Ecdysteroid kinase-like family